MKIINCAIIGFGNIGKIQAEFLIRNKNTNLKYIYEKKITRLKKNLKIVSNKQNGFLLKTKYSEVNNFCS